MMITNNDLRPEAAEVAGELIRLLVKKRHYAAVVDSFERLGTVSEVLGFDDRVHVIESYIKVGQFELAEFELGQMQSNHDGVREARKLRLLAECKKAALGEGYREQTLELIGFAIKACSDVRSNDARNLGTLYELDKAWILQFLFYDYDQAMRIYQSVQSTDLDDLNQAVLLRNYALCLYSNANAQSNDRKNTQLAIEKALLALDFCMSYSYSPLQSELFYDLSKYHFAIDQRSESLTYLEKAIEAANVAGYESLVAVARSRKFFRFEEFEFETWSEIRKSLEYFSTSAWPLRVLMDCRVRAARHFSINGNKNEAIAELTENTTSLPKLSSPRGSDRFRIAVTYAGLCDLTKDDVYYSRFMDYEWALDWLAGRELVDIWRNQ